MVKSKKIDTKVVIVIILSVLVLGALIWFVKNRDKTRENFANVNDFINKIKEFCGKDYDYENFPTPTLAAMANKLFEEDKENFIYIFTTLAEEVPEEDRLEARLSANAGKYWKKDGASLLKAMRYSLIEKITSIPNCSQKLDGLKNIS